MGSIISSIKRGIESIARFNSTVSEMRQNIAVFRKCTKDVASIMNDLKSISNEVKETVSECSSELKRILCDQIYCQLSEEDIEKLSHIVFYNKFIMRISEMQKTDGEVLTGNMQTYLFAETSDRIKEYKNKWNGDERKIMLLVELEKYLAECSRYGIDTMSSFDEGNTMLTSLDETCKAIEVDNSCKIDAKEELDESGDHWIAMTSFAHDGKISAEPEAKKERRLHAKDPRRSICKWRKIQLTDAAKKMKNLQVFCSLLELQTALHETLSDYLSKRNFEEMKPANASFISRIIEGEDIFRIENESYSLGMAKINTLLENIIKKRDLTNLKIRIKYDVNFKEVLPIVEDAATKMSSAKTGIIDDIRDVKSVLLADAKSIQIERSSEIAKKKSELQIVPFQETFSFIKDKSVPKLESHLETIVQKCDVLNMQAILQLADDLGHEDELKRGIYLAIKRTATRGENDSIKDLFKIIEKVAKHGKNDCFTEAGLKVIFSAMKEDFNLQGILREKLIYNNICLSRERLSRLQKFSKQFLENKEEFEGVLHRILDREEVEAMLKKMPKDILRAVIEETPSLDPKSIIKIAAKILFQDKIAREIFDIGDKLLLTKKEGVQNIPLIVKMLNEWSRKYGYQIKSMEDLKTILIKDILLRALH